MEDMDGTSPSAGPSAGNAGEPVDPYGWPPADIQQAEAWPGFNAGLPAPPGYPLPPGPGARPPARRRRAVVAGLIAVTLLLSGVIGVTGGSFWHHGQTATIAQRVSPAIVNIDTFRTTFNSTTTSLAPLGAGTGMILSSNGEILTNNHVVQGAAKIEVEVAGHSGLYIADVVGVDPTDDVALLQLEGASGLPTVSIGSASSLSPGQGVTALGNAGGLGGAPSVTTGTISDLHISITAGDPGGSSEQLTDLIQTNAAIRPGDSGGALVNSDGQVVGMITAGQEGTDAQTPSTVGFAIPVDNALNVVTEIRAGHGSSTILLGERGFLGVSVDPTFDFSTAPALKIDATSGAFVNGVEPGSPAAAAGLTGPAVIQSVDGQAVKSTDDLGPLLHVHVPGDKVEVTWVDAKGTHTATITLGPGPAV
jgi:S1-C subfamily serine protease